MKIGPLLVGSLCVSVLFAVGNPVLAQGKGQQRGKQGGQENRGGGDPSSFRTEVPNQPLSVILNSPTDRSICLSIHGTEKGAASLAVRDKNGKTILNESVNPESNPNYKVEGLNPGETYFFQVDQGDRRVTGQFCTQKKVQTPFRFVIQADSHLDNNSDPAVYGRTLDNMVADKPDFLVDLGDTFMVDKYADYRESARHYVAQRYWLSRLGSQASIFLCLGNHDGEVGWAGRGGVSTTEWARAQRQKFFPGPDRDGFYSGVPKTGLYYAWDWGDASFVVLDPFVATLRKVRNDQESWNWTLGDEQYRWLKATLENSKKKYKFVFIHHLVGGLGKEARGGVEVADRFEWGDDSGYPDHRPSWTDSLHQLFRKTKVSAVFHGHDHLYVHQEKDGIAYLEVPQPSHARGDSTSSADEYGYKSGKLLGSSGHIKVSVALTSARVEYVKSLPGPGNGQVVDAFEIKSGP